MQAAPRPSGRACELCDPRLVEPEELARPDVSLDGGADQIERAALGGDDPVVADPAEHERPNPVRVAEGDERVVDERDDGVRALEARHRRGDGLGQRRRVAGDQGCDDLGVRGRAEPDPIRDELVAESPGVRQVAVVAERNGSGASVMDEGLSVRPVHAPGRRVARVPDRDLTRERLELLLVEDLRDEPHVAEHGQATRLGDGDAGRLLAAMLQREEREVRQPRHIAVGRADTEHAAHQWLTLPDGSEVGEGGAEDLVPADLADASHRRRRGQKSRARPRRRRTQGSPGRGLRRREQPRRSRDRAGRRRRSALLLRRVRQPARRPRRHARACTAARDRRRGGSGRLPLPDRATAAPPRPSRSAPAAPSPARPGCPPRRDR